MGARYRVSTSGAGSYFEALIYERDPANRLNDRLLEKSAGFRSRAEAVSWGRARVKQLSSLAPTI